MPIYEYRCENGHTFEAFQSMADDALDKCEVCGAAAQRVLSAPAIHYKGSGFYTTDYARKGKKPGTSGGSGGSDSSGGSEGSGSGSGSKSSDGGGSKSSGSDGGGSKDKASSGSSSGSSSSSSGSGS